MLKEWNCHLRTLAAARFLHLVANCTDRRRPSDFSDNLGLSQDGTCPGASDYNNPFLHR